METMKKQWEKPFVGVQEFVPSEYCAPCGDGMTEVTYYFMCDAGQGNQYKVWLDNGDKVFQQSRDTQLTDRWHVFEPCAEKHEVTVPKDQEGQIDNIFPYGWIVRYDYQGLHTNEATLVRIWRGKNNDDIHCTTHLDTSSYTPHNPS